MVSMMSTGVDNEIVEWDSKKVISKAVLFLIEERHKAFDEES